MGARRFGFSENGAIIELLAGSRLHTMRGPSNLIKSTACYRCLVGVSFGGNSKTGRARAGLGRAARGLGLFSGYFRAGRNF